MTKESFTEFLAATGNLLDENENHYLIFDGAPVLRRREQPRQNVHLRMSPPYSPFLNIVEQACQAKSCPMASVKGDSPLHQFRPRGRSDLVRACAIKHMHKTFRPRWRSQTRRASRNVFYFQGVYASAKACGKPYACVFSRMLLQVRSARAGEAGISRPVMQALKQVFPALLCKLC